MFRDRYSEPALSRQARAAELLDATTEAALALAWRERQDTAALDRLITAHLRLAIAGAARFRRQGAPMNDLVQEAALGLMKAAEKFDPSKGVRFSTYAAFWIKAALQDFVMRNWSLVRTGSTAGQKTLFFNLRRTEAALDRRDGTGDPASRPQRIADELGVTLAEVEMMSRRLRAGDASLNTPQAGDEEGREWIEILPDEAPSAEVQVSETLDQARLRRGLALALARLTPRECRIVAARQLAETPRTLDSLGAELGISKERVRQLEQAAYAKLRATIRAEAPELQALLG